MKPSRSWREWHGGWAPDDGFLIGFDLVKDPARLEAAYNDAAGVTEQFSLNLLRVVNRELAGDLPIENFRHRAIYNAAEERIEAYVVAQESVRARIEAIDLDLVLEPGDRIRTELSHKYTQRSVQALVEKAGLELVRWDTDPDSLFAVALTRVLPPHEADRLRQVAVALARPCAPELLTTLAVEGPQTMAALESRPDLVDWFPAASGLLSIDLISYVDGRVEIRDSARRLLNRLGILPES